MYLILHGWRRWNDAERAPGKGSLSYARKAYEVKTKMIRSAWESRMYNGPGAVCSASTSATRAVPWPLPVPSQIPYIPGEPINPAQTRTTPRHPTERRVRAGPPPCVCQSRQTRRLFSKSPRGSPRHKTLGFCRQVWRLDVARSGRAPLLSGVSPECTCRGLWPVRP